MYLSTTIVSPTFSLPRILASLPYRYRARRGFTNGQFIEGGEHGGGVAGQNMQLKRKLRRIVRADPYN